MPLSIGRTKRRAAFFKSIVLALISILITLYSFELVLALLPTHTPDELRMQKAKTGETPFDTRDEWEVVSELRRTKREVYPLIAPSQFWADNGLPTTDRSRIFPLGSIAGATTVYCNENGIYSVYENDQHGLNNPESEKYQSTEVVLVGDSFAQGACVNPPNDVAGQLRALRHRVINLGFGGNGPLTEFAGIREYARPMKPKYVIWLYFEGNDVTDLEFERKVPTLMRYFEADFSQGLIDRQAEIDDVLRTYIREFEQSRAGKFVVEGARKRVSISGILGLVGVRRLLGEARRLAGDPVYLQELHDNLDLFEQTLRLAKREIEGWNGMLLFVYLPAQDRYTSPVRTHNAHLYQRSAVLNIVRRIGIEILDFHVVLGAQADPLQFFPFGVWGHYTADGYALLAGEIHRFLLERGSRPGKSGASVSLTDG